MSRTLSCVFRWEEPEPDHETRIKRLERMVAVLGVVLLLLTAALSFVVSGTRIQVRTDRSQNNALDSLITIVNRQLQFNAEQVKSDRLQNSLLGVPAHAP